MRRPFELRRCPCPHAQGLCHRGCAGLGVRVPMRPVSASGSTPSTFQQQFFSAIVELAIAAALALPELLRPRHQPSARMEETTRVAEETTEVAPAEPTIAAPSKPQVVASAPTCDG